MNTYTLPFSKVLIPVSYDQLQKLVKFSNLKSMPSSSQILKRMDTDMFEEILSDLKKGIEVEIEG